MDMYSRVKRRKSLRRNTYGMQAHHKVMSKSKDPEEEEGTEGRCELSKLPYLQINYLHTTQLTWFTYFNFFNFNLG